VTTSDPARQPGSSDDPLRGWVDDDLADRLAGEERVDIDLTAVDLTVAEWSRTSWLDRVRRAAEAGLTLASVHGVRRVGRVEEVLVDGFVLVDATAQILVPAHAVQTLHGLPALVASGTPPRCRSCAGVLRSWAVLGQAVTVRTVSAVQLSGSLAIVGTDHLDLLTPGLADPPRRSATATTVLWSTVAEVVNAG
jgi:hypothetical protein